jgi:hypothetical protein
MIRSVVGGFGVISETVKGSVQGVEGWIGLGGTDLGLILVVMGWR